MRTIKAAMLLSCLVVASTQAGPFNRGIGGAMYYGPYTGGHLLPYNTAYGYGFAFNSTDTWRRDPIAYPGGITPYRPYERPILYRAFPLNPTNPPVAVPGPDGLPVLRTPAPVAGAPVLQPVPEAGTFGTIRVTAPKGARVWVEKEELPGDGERVYRTQELAAGVMKIYSLRASWVSAGRTVEQFRVVGVKAGETARVEFTTGG
jgi:uncharacterized protein (TIGR03000 family)